MNKNLVILTCIFVLLVLVVSALAANNQKNEKFEIKLKAKQFIPNEGLSIAADAKIKSLLSSEKIHLLIQFEHDLTEDEITELEQEGVKLLSNIPRKARYISVPVGKVNEISKKEYVRAVDVIKAEYKIQEDVKE